MPTVSSFNREESTVSGTSEDFRKRRIVDPTQVARIGELYSLFLILDDGRTQEQADLDPSKQRIKSEYIFNVPPKSLTITEPFTTHIVPTQGGGKFVEAHGSIIKDIRIEGTTGFRPKKKASLGNQGVLPPGAAGASQIVGSLVTSPVASPTLDPAEITGHDDILFLRNFFRHYSDMQQRADYSLRMVFRNLKDDDYWIVEPQNVVFSQNSASPFTYNYNITLKTLTRYEHTLGPLKDSQESRRALRQLGTRLRFYQQSVENAFAIVATEVRRVRAAGYLAIDVTLGHFTDVVRNINSIGTELKLTKISIKTAAKEARQGARDAIDALKDTFPLQDPVIRELRRTAVICDRIIAEPGLSDNTPANTTFRTVSINNAYTRDVVSPGSSTNVAVDIVNAGDTIRSLAQRLIGDSQRWQDLVVLNDLKAPYVSQDPNAPDGVLRPTDSVLYPSVVSIDLNSTGISSAAIPSGRNKSNTSENVDNMITESYGRDLRLRSVEGQGFSLTDIAIGQADDLDTIIGIPNVSQAVKLKFSTEPGELIHHPFFGGIYGIGRKATPKALNEFRLNVMATFNSDPRIKKIDKLDMVAQADVLFVVSRLLLMDSKNYLGVQFPIRN